MTQQLVAYRSANWDTPYHVLPNRLEARFNRAGDPPTQYLALHPLVPFAERLRALGPARVKDRATFKWRTWVSRHVSENLVHIDFDSASSFGITPENLVSDDYGACQWLATQLRDGEVEAIRVPSAALPGTDNLILFGPRVVSPYLLEPIDPAIDVATGHAAEWSIPPEELLALVRWHGERHAALDAWRRGVPFEFRDPKPSEFSEEREG